MMVTHKHSVVVLQVLIGIFRSHSPKLLTLTSFSRWYFPSLLLFVDHHSGVDGSALVLTTGT